MLTTTTVGQTLVNRLFTLMIALVALMGCSQPNEPSLALYLAVQRGDIEQIERHIAWGSDINELDKDGLSPLHVAANKGRYVVVKLLLNSGANADAKDRNGNTPLSTALLAGRIQIAELLKQKGASTDANQLLMQVVLQQASDRDVLALLVKWNADLNHTTKNGQTPLAVAISQADLKMAKLLIRSGVDVNKPNREKVSPLELAEKGQNPDIIRLLQKHGAQKK